MPRPIAKLVDNGDRGQVLVYLTDSEDPTALDMVVVVPGDGEQVQWLRRILTTSGDVDKARDAFESLTDAGVRELAQPLYDVLDSVLSNPENFAESVVPE